MINKEIICVYQDCYLCGDRGKRIKSLAFKKGLNIRKVGFSTEEGRKLIAKMIEQNGPKFPMPFFTDGEKFSNNFRDFLPKPAKSAKKSRKTTASEDESQITETETENGDVSED